MSMPHARRTRWLSLLITLGLADCARHAPAPPVLAPDPPPPVEDAWLREVRRITRHDATVLGCYRTALAQHPGLTGTIDLRFTVVREGGLREPPVATGMPEAPAVAPCIAHAVTVLPNFAPPEREREVTVAVHLTPAELPPEEPPPPVNDAERDASEVAAAIRGQIEAIRECYNAAQARDRSLAGRMTVRFTIRADGTVADPVTTEGLERAPAVGRCVAGLIARLRFTATTGDVDFSFPFNFTPGG